MGLTYYPSSLNNGSNVFVFGSNTAGRHGRGAALEAIKSWGAVYGVGEGFQGQSYAIPTKGKRLNCRTLAEIQASVQSFKVYAAQHPEKTFLVTRIGCGLAGFKDYEIAPMFKDAPKNCVLPKEWD